LPSLQWSLVTAFPPEKLAAIGVNNTASRSWLMTYRGQKGISFPFVLDDKSQLFNLYQVGASYGNIPPTYIIVDTTGIVRYRINDTFDKVEEMKGKIRELLGQ